MDEDIITMTRRELERCQVIERTLKRDLTPAKAGELSARGADGRKGGRRRVRAVVEKGL